RQNGPQSTDRRIHSDSRPKGFEVPYSESSKRCNFGCPSVFRRKPSRWLAASLSWWRGQARSTHRNRCGRGIDEFPPWVTNVFQSHWLTFAEFTNCLRVI